MPQFDKITFFNQVFWLFICFGSFYLIVLKMYLPYLGISLKTRAKKSKNMAKASALVFQARRSEVQQSLSFNSFRIFKIAEPFHILVTLKYAVVTHFFFAKGLKNVYFLNSLKVLKGMVQKQAIFAALIKHV